MFRMFNILNIGGPLETTIPWESDQLCQSEAGRRTDRRLHISRTRSNFSKFVGKSSKRLEIINLTPYNLTSRSMCVYTHVIQWPLIPRENIYFFGILWDFLGFFSDFSGFFWDFILNIVGEFFSVIYSSINSIESLVSSFHLGQYISDYWYIGKSTCYIFSVSHEHYVFYLIAAPYLKQYIIWHPSTYQLIFLPLKRSRRQGRKKTWKQLYEMCWEKWEVSMWNMLKLSTSTKTSQISR